MTCLETIGRIVSEFARLILFLSSVVFLVFALILLAFSYESRRYISYAKVEDINTGLVVLVCLSIYLIGLAVIGLFASFFSSKSALRLMVYMLTLNIVVGIAVLVASTSQFDQARVTLSTTLDKYQAEYDWHHTKTPPNQATLAWDSLQSNLHCCGMKQPSDWGRHRPSDVGAESMPISCCTKTDQPNSLSSDKYCTSKDQVFPNGCLTYVWAAFAAIIYVIIGIVCFSLLLDILAAIVLICHPSRSQFNNYGYAT